MRPGTHRRMMRGCLHGAYGNLLDLQRYYIASASQVGGGKNIIPGSRETAVNYEARRAGGIRIEHLHAVSQRTRRHGSHSPQLSSTQDADGCAGKDRAQELSSCCRTSSVRALRQARRRSRISGLCKATMAMASRAALAAPGLPIARVPTGTPLGIWTMESNESTPLSKVAGIGTPSTGNIVLDATMPGKCAAPPAAAIITCSPRDSALVAYSNIQSGVR